MNVTVLGSGTSHGIPMIGCRCPVCTSDDPRNRRTRASILIQWNDRNVLVDTAVELRLQAIAARLDRVDAVLFTHQHADHVCGFDDLRRFCSLQRSEIPCYGHPDAIGRLREMFPYVLDSASHRVFEIPVVTFHEVTGPFELFGRTVTPVPLVHGSWPCYGWRVGNFAYCTDVRKIAPASRDMLRGLDVLILDALRHREHPTHMTVEQALDVIADVAPRQTYLTHIAHDLDHAATEAALPPTIRLAFDGLTIQVDV